MSVIMCRSFLAKARLAWDDPYVGGLDKAVSAKASGCKVTAAAINRYSASKGDGSNFHQLYTGYS